MRPCGTVTFPTPCEACGGSGLGRDAPDDCPECGGTGAQWHQTCPRAYPDPWTWNLLDAHVAAKEYHALPEPGGYLDQSAWLIDAFRAARRAEAEALRRPSNGS